MSNTLAVHWELRKPYPGTYALPTIVRALRLLTTAIVIVRRVVAARRAHTSGLSATPQKGNALYSHTHSASRTQPLTPLGDKEGIDMTDFPERPGAKKTKRGGFWARFKCW